ncbi:MAG: hypothetical protein VX191_01450 [Candidatus Thermoplasmatota archaeon]|nr:hypothetical protein [Candidatus Thermoplasmatota archaeon]MED6313254.1 hypothetical protein [Candidatus Thermoplasmatota archaeon]MEE3303534.1 hypothetical protein [Candidatus Thermoplasmatota archaeon]
MVDLASTLFGVFQDSIVTTFGDTLGWVIGHTLIVGLVALVWCSWIGRNHIRTQSGWGMSNLRDIATILALTMAQYVVYTSNFDFSELPALGVAFAATMLARWCINVLN